jgi:hypothetical protein
MVMYVHDAMLDFMRRAAALHDVPAHYHHLDWGPPNAKQRARNQMA